MDIGSIFLILALLLLVGLFVSRPLFERRAVAVSREEHELSFLMAERDRILTALQELDFDHSLGKIPAEDYPGQRAALLQRGADILRQMDQYGDKASEADWEAVVADDDSVEAAIAARRRETGRQAQRRRTPLQSRAAVVADDDKVEDDDSVEDDNQVADDNQVEDDDQVKAHDHVEADDDLEAQIAARRRSKREKAAGFCPQCGRAVQKSDQFCPKCGERLG